MGQGLKMPTGKGDGTLRALSPLSFSVAIKTFSGRGMDRIWSHDD
jgi:hypothetical protein